MGQNSNNLECGENPESLDPSSVRNQSGQDTSGIGNTILRQQTNIIPTNLPLNLNQLPTLAQNSTNFPYTNSPTTSRITISFAQPNNDQSVRSSTAVEATTQDSSPSAPSFDPFLARRLALERVNDQCSQLIDSLNASERATYLHLASKWATFRIAELKTVLGHFRLSCYGRKQNLVDRLRMYYLENSQARMQLKEKIEQTHQSMYEYRYPARTFHSTVASPTTSSYVLPQPQPSLQDFGKPGENIEKEIDVQLDPLWESTKVVKQTLFGGHSYGNKNSVFMFHIKLEPDVRKLLDPNSPNCDRSSKLILTCVKAGPVGSVAAVQYPRYVNVSIQGHYLKVSSNDVD
jgi:hypothetical protein